MKKIADSITEQIHMVRYQHLNGQRRLFGGMLLQWIDELAGTVAFRHTGGEVITAAIDNLVFKEPAFLNDLIVLKGKITFIGNTSMEVRVDTYVENAEGRRTMINQAYFVMVSLDGDGVPRPIPKVELCGGEEQADWQAGEKRYKLRRQRRIENY
ncbi:acyl-CoA thioesterase [Ruminococcaceae bacterium OttesenSCG-928-I18]|nr:acyl-CoA thioesterase [Ruminococcaceae bacterium OttesenSCG-928-I18]